MIELNENQIRRQDFVDNAIYNLVRELVRSQQEIQWDIEMIGDIRDHLRYWLVQRLKLIDDMAYYPFVRQAP